MFRPHMAAIAAAALTAAPAAVADPPSYACRYAGVRDSQGGTAVSGVLLGVGAHPDGPASFRCRITVNGVTVATALQVAGTPVAVTDASFSASDTDVVRVCSDYSSPHGSGSSCVTQNPDTVAEALDRTSEVACAVLPFAAGTYGPVTVDDDGDVRVGNLTFDCYPYASRSSIEMR